MRSMLYVALVGVLAFGCGSSDDDATGSGGAAGSGGTSGKGGSTASGGTSGNGGSSASGGSAGSNGGSGGSSGSGGASGKGGTSGSGGSSAAGGSAGTAGSAACSGTGAMDAGGTGASADSCPDYVDCVETKCSMCNDVCQGANDCSSACGCDQTCLQGCADQFLSGECGDCIQGSTTCIQEQCGNELVGCLSGNGEAHTCEELAACCATLDESQQSSCNQAVTAGMSNPTVCSLAYGILCPTN